jgi:hypothetical protein
MVQWPCSMRSTAKAEQRATAGLPQRPTPRHDALERAATGARRRPDAWLADERNECRLLRGPASTRGRPEPMS